MMMMLVYVVVAMVLVLVRWCWISLEFCRVITLYFMHFIKPRRQKKNEKKTISTMHTLYRDKRFLCAHSKHMNITAHII